MEHPLGLTWTGRIKVSASKDGYYYAVKCPDHPRAWKNGYVYEHRIILECKIGRLLTDEEVAHHKNEVKSDNSVDNLEVKLRADHASKHRPAKRTVILTCSGCGVDFERAWKDRPEVRNVAHVYCSNKCRAAVQPPPSQVGKTWVWARS